MGLIHQAMHTFKPEFVAKSPATRTRPATPMASPLAAERFIERRAWVEEAAGDRFADLELQINTFMVSLTRTSKEADDLFENLAPVFGVTPQQAREIPLVLAGTVNDVCEQLQHRREIYGVSYIVFPSTEIRNLAPVVERLAGT